MPLTDTIQQFTYLLGFIVVMAYAFRLIQHSLLFKTILFFTIAVISYSLSIFYFVRGLIGDFSLTTSALLFINFLRLSFYHWHNEAPSLLNRSENVMIFLMGLALYSSSLGFMKFDLYSLGYASLSILLLFAFSIFLFIIKNKILGYVWLFALIGFYFQLQHSNNLWDYLIDPILWMSQSGKLCYSFFKKKSLKANLESC
jgi:hypothetical protein